MIVWAEILGSVLSLGAVWLTARRRLAGYPVGLVSVLVYGAVFVASRLYSDALLQGIFGIMIVWGWLDWSPNIGGDQRVRIARLHAAPAIRHCAFGAIGAVALGFVMWRWTNAALPWLDATLTAFSLVAQWWQNHRHTAAWWLWIIVDVVYIGEYIYKDLRITAVLYAAFVLLAVHGLRVWRQAGPVDPSATDAIHRPSRT